MAIVRCAEGDHSVQINSGAAEDKMKRWRDNVEKSRGAPAAEAAAISIGIIGSRCSVRAVVAAAIIRVFAVGIALVTAVPSLPLRRVVAPLIPPNAPPFAEN